MPAYHDVANALPMELSSKSRHTTRLKIVFSDKGGPGPKLNLKKSVMTSFQWRHRYYVTENVTKPTSQDFLILPIKISISGCATAYRESRFLTVIYCYYWEWRCASSNRVQNIYA